MKDIFSKVVTAFKAQPVFWVAAFAAVLSMFAVPPSADYAGYFDWDVLILLFCLMSCVAGLTEAGVFARTAQVLLGRQLTERVAAGVLVMLCFFVSMLVTNDVSLITFVPFTLLLFTAAGRTKGLAVVIVLETVAANLGSMATPMGNPQNLFLFEHYGLTAGEMLVCIGPCTVLSLVLLLLCCTVLVGKSQMAGSGLQESGRIRVQAAVIFALLFVVSVLAVVHVIPSMAALVIVVAGTLVVNRRVLRKVNWFLLATFFCFFIFSGNLSHISAVQQALVSLMTQMPFVSSLLVSQVISNVPAAVLLAPFTVDWQSLMLGVDIGGLGTPVASLASLISLEYYRHAQLPGQKLSRFLLIFTLLNVAFLAANILFGCALGMLP